MLKNYYNLSNVYRPFFIIFKEEDLLRGFVELTCNCSVLQLAKNQNQKQNKTKQNKTKQNVNILQVSKLRK
jgi:hypothetical protein